MYDLGDVVSKTLTVENEAGVAENAGDVTATITLPDGTTTSPTVNNTGPGLYKIEYPTVQAGRHLLRWLATGLNAGADTDAFDVASAEWPAIVSLTDAKKQLRIPLDNYVNDDELRRYMESATAVVEHFVGAVVRRTETQTVSGCGTALVLWTTPVLSVTSVVESGTTLAADEYSLNADLGILTRMMGSSARRWLAGVNNVTATYLVGRPNLPANHVLAALMIIQDLWESKRGSGSPKYGGSPRFAGSEEHTVVPGFNFAIPNDAVELLSPDRKPSGIA